MTRAEMDQQENIEGALVRWLNRLDVMQRTQCVELTAKEAGELRALLEGLGARLDAALGAYGPITPEPLPIHEAPTYIVATTAPTLHVFPGDGSVHEVKSETEESSFAWLCGTGLSPDPNQATPAARCAKPYGHKGPCRPETEAERAGRLMVEAARNR